MKQTPKRLRFLDRFLTLWIFSAMFLGFFSTTSGSTGTEGPAEAGTPVALRAPFFPASAEISLGDDGFNGIVFIVITSTRPTLIFQWVGVSLTLAQRARNSPGQKARTHLPEGNERKQHGLQLDIVQSGKNVFCPR